MKTERGVKRESGVRINAWVVLAVVGLGLAAWQWWSPAEERGKVTLPTRTRAARTPRVGAIGRGSNQALPQDSSRTTAERGFSAREGTVVSPAAPAPAPLFEDPRVTAAARAERQRIARASSAGATESDDDPDLLTMPGAVVDADPISGGVPLQVVFEAEFDDPPPGLTFRWDFGDGDSVVGQLTPTHTYIKVGEYTATFSWTWNGESNDLTIDISVTPTAFEVEVEAEPDSGRAPLAVRLTATVDEDEIEVREVRWDFGDRSQEHGAEVRHVYDAHGEYEVTVTVINRLGQRGVSTVTIDVEGPDDDDDDSQEHEGTA